MILPVDRLSFSCAFAILHIRFCPLMWNTRDLGGGYSLHVTILSISCHNPLPLPIFSPLVFICSMVDEPGGDLSRSHLRLLFEVFTLSYRWEDVWATHQARLFAGFKTLPISSLFYAFSVSTKPILTILCHRYTRAGAFRHKDIFQVHTPHSCCYIF